MVISPLASTLTNPSVSLIRSGFQKCGPINRRTLLKPVQILQGNDDILFFENIGKATLRQTAMQRHLAALKTRTAAVAGTGTGTFVTAGRGFAASASRSTCQPAFCCGAIPQTA